MRRFLLLAPVVGLLSACDTYHYIAGTWREDSRKPSLALKHYEKFLAHRPRDPRACEVRLRTAEIYRTVFDRCGEARRHYEAAARDFPRQLECAERGKRGLMRCPDFFPLDVGRTWVYVDSASRGKAMRLDWELRESSGTEGGVVLESLFAGAKRVQQGAKSYLKDDWALWRVEGKAREPILRYPYDKGRVWEAKRGKSTVEWTVVEDAASVTVAAGTFSGCLKLRERDDRYPKSWRFDYYCPGVGRVKTTVGGPGVENPNIELLRFDKIR